MEMDMSNAKRSWSRDETRKSSLHAESPSRCHFTRVDSSPGEQVCTYATAVALRVRLMACIFASFGTVRAELLDKPEGISMATCASTYRRRCACVCDVCMFKPRWEIVHGISEANEDWYSTWFKGSRVLKGLVRDTSKLPLAQILRYQLLL